MSESQNPNRDQVAELFRKPLVELVFESARIHRDYHPAREIKLNTLISVKTGACGEDCAYCAQSSRYNTGIDSSFLSLEEVIAQAKRAKQNGASRICLSASQREMLNKEQLSMYLKMAAAVRELGMDVCCTLGMLNKETVAELKNAGFSAYNHNLDTSERFYPEIITTRKWSERLETIDMLIDSDMPFCSGGIIGMGENEDDRIDLIYTLASRKKHPYSIPFNFLVPIKGTPLGNESLRANTFDMLRLIATSRILMPTAIICLAAGRESLSDEAQFLCFMAGANSIFIGDKLLTTENKNPESDTALLSQIGLIPAKNS